MGVVPQAVVADLDLLPFTRLAGEQARVAVGILADVLRDLMDDHVPDRVRPELQRLVGREALVDGLESETGRRNAVRSIVPAASALRHAPDGELVPAGVVNTLRVTEDGGE